MNREADIFEAAADLPEAERPAFLDAACNGDPELRERVGALLRSHEVSGFMEEVTVASDDTDPLAAWGGQQPEKAGQQIGHYKLLEQIGEGGFGVVWVAEQLEPVRRRVAVKIIKAGMDSREIMARFEQERQALAMMDHPNIAKVLDAGATETGRPYFVMELVPGVRMTDYCDAANLSTPERLRLFIAVCHAVQHAHQKGIIHRDLKPSNILVASGDESQPVPKVIDFGVAKALRQHPTDETAYTHCGQMIGTPAYMSPEQTGPGPLDIDTRSDVYSLGVLLYELLTGHTPFDPRQLLSAGPDEMRRIIREVEPSKPSTRRTQLLTAAAAPHSSWSANRNPASRIDADLDWIVMKALEKDRGRRYETANGFAADVERYLADEPVSAGPPGFGYRTGKFVRRHKGMVAAATAVLVTILGGIGFTTVAWMRERVALANETHLRQEAAVTKGSAMLEAERNSRTAGFLDELLSGIRPDEVTGEDLTLLKQVLDNSAGRLSTRLRNQPEVEANLRRILGAAYQRLGLTAEARQQQEKAMERSRNPSEPKPPEANGRAP